MAPYQDNTPTKRPFQPLTGTMAEAFLAAAKLRRQRVSATPPATDSQVTEPDTCRIGVGWVEHSHGA